MAARELMSFRFPPPFEKDLDEAVQLLVARDKAAKLGYTGRNRTNVVELAVADLLTTLRLEAAAAAAEDEKAKAQKAKRKVDK